MKPKYKRVLFKLSGEGLADETHSISPETLVRLAGEIKAVYDEGIEICLVVGGGNIFRGVSGASRGMDRATADYIGMLATVMNALSLQEALEKVGVPTRVQSALAITAVAEPFIRRRALRHLEKKRVVIFAAGTGSPYFTTDTCAVLRATEMGCDACFKSTQVDGVYDDDPRKNPNAKLYKEVSYQEALDKKLKVMDLTAIAMAQDSGLPIIVFNQKGKGAFLNVVCGDGTFTVMK